MGLLMKEEDVERVRRIAERERAPMYTVGETTNDMKFVFEQADGVKPIDIKLEYMFGKPPRTVMTDHTVETTYQPVAYKEAELHHYLENVLQLEAVACKDWLTNKVDRSVTGKIARQQCQGELQLPLSDLGAVALDYRGKAGIATSIGHAPQVAMVDPAAGSVMAIAESLTNIVFAPLADKLSGVSLSANWMWPCRNEGEDARLYTAVQAASDFACALGINIPTGKDSLSMTQKYGDDKVVSPGTVIISAGAEVSDIRKIVSPVLAHEKNSYLYYIDFSFDTLKLGGSAFAQALNKLGNEVPTVQDPEYFQDAFNAIQEAIEQGLILAGHDISAGGMITTLLEMCFANVEGGLDVNLDKISEQDIVKILFAENPGIIVQVKDDLSHDYPYGKQRVDRGGMWYTPVSGIWQSVWIESVSKDYVKKVTITPHIDENNVNVSIDSESDFVEIKIYDEDKVIYKDKSNINSFVIHIDNPKLWSPENPFLYDVIIKTKHDEIKTYFAMRKISTNDKYILLNNKPYFIHGLLDQGYFPDGIYTPASYEAFKDDILTMKKLGFNCLRKHIKIEPMMFYYYCDKYHL